MRKKYKLEKSSKMSKAIFAGGVISLALALSLGTSSGPNVNQESEYQQFSHQYLQTLQKMDYNEYDANFINIYKNGKYVIDGKTYDVSELYLVVMDDLQNHIIKAGDNFDIISGEILQENKTRIICLRDTSIFFDLYQKGIISSENIFIDKDTLKQYVDSWDGQKQYMVPELAASKEASDYVKKAK
ncbi:MAG: hypothetical protein IJ093_03430 [Bacilli bacterium]|nr:hypothetical protein [Bacilli bacterium]